MTGAEMVGKMMGIMFGFGSWEGRVADLDHGEDEPPQSLLASSREWVYVFFFSKIEYLLHVRCVNPLIEI